MTTPEVRYARSGDVHIAYQVTGDGPRDLVWVPGWVSNLQVMWEDPGYARFLRRLGSFARLILFDKRGTGLSDRVAIDQLPTMEERMDDIRAVMQAAGSERAALFGASEGGPLCALFAASYPERTEALVMFGAYARWEPDPPDYPYGVPRDVVEQFNRAAEATWGDNAHLLQIWAPTVADDVAMQARWNRYLVQAASPAAASAFTRMNAEIDIRHVLPVIRVPTLVIHRTGDRLTDVRHSRYLAENVPSARYVELPGSDHLWFVGDWEAVVEEVEEFLTGVRPGREPDRVLTTVLFTDIVGSTRRAAALGDRRWQDVLSEHDRLVREELGRFRGREVKTAGDGFLATFDGPARAIRCAREIVEAVRDLGLEIRAGLHTGEIELVGDDIRGIAVHIGARVSGLAEPGEVLVSSTVKDLVAGSGIEFEDRGPHELKGVPDEWRLFAVTSS